jgi:hypothetical protein
MSGKEKSPGVAPEARKLEPPAGSALGSGHSQTLRICVEKPFSIYLPAIGRIVIKAFVFNGRNDLEQRERGSFGRKVRWWRRNLQMISHVV